MLSPQIRALVKATAPVLKTHGEALTRHFYARMFQHNPELKHIFNQGHQAVSYTHLDVYKRQAAYRATVVAVCRYWGRPGTERCARRKGFAWFAMQVTKNVKSAGL